VGAEKRGDSSRIPIEFPQHRPSHLPWRKEFTDVKPEDENIFGCEDLGSSSGFFHRIDDFSLHYPTLSSLYIF
jgi:hypothetical protein